MKHFYTLVFTFMYQNKLFFNQKEHEYSILGMQKKRVAMCMAIQIGSFFGSQNCFGFFFNTGNYPDCKVVRK